MWTTRFGTANKAHRSNFAQVCAEHPSAARLFATLARVTLACIALASCASAPVPASRAETSSPQATYAEQTGIRAGLEGVTRVREITVTSEDVPQRLDGYRIGFVSDVHLGNNYTEERMARLIEEVNAERFDFVILGGDYTRNASYIKRFAELAGRLRARDGVCAIPGNHDVMNGKAATARALEGAGIRVLDQSTAKATEGLLVSGIGDLRFEYPDMEKTSKGIDAADFAILAAHNPDIVEESAFDRVAGLYDLVLSGHTHGGQITLFGFAPIVPSRYGSRYRTGIVQKGDAPVIVSNGVGYSGKVLFIRVCAPSDFLALTLRSRAPSTDR